MSSAKLATAISAEDHAQGPADAAITLVQYGDYECPYTRLSRQSVHQLQREFADDLRFVFRHFPVAATAEALKILRDAFGDTGRVVSRGDHYPVPGYQAGPPPAHDIRFWVGAVKPRMLQQ